MKWLMQLLKKLRKTSDTRLPPAVTQSWRSTYEAEKKSKNWRIGSVAYAKERERKVLALHNQACAIKVLLRRQKRERAELVAELERTREARAWALTYTEILEDFPTPPRNSAH